MRIGSNLKNSPLMVIFSENLPKFIGVILVMSLAISSSVFAEEEEDSTEATEESSSESDSTLTRVGSLNVEALQQELLAKEFKTNEVVWLEADYPLPEESENDKPLDPVKVLALKKDSHKAQKHGAVLLLHDKDQHADWPHLIRPIRTILPESGWFSLSVNLPFEKRYFDDVPERSLPAKGFDEITVSDELRIKLLSRIASAAKSKGEESSEEVEEEKSEEDSDASLETGDSNSDQEKGSEGSVDIDLADPKEILLKIPYEKRVLAHLEAAAAYLQNEGYQNVVLIAYGSSANAALTYVKQRQGQFSNRGFALVLIDPKLEPELQEDVTLAFGKNFPAPVLDMLTKKDSDMEVLAAERKVSATVGGIQRYMQLFMPATPDSVSNTIPRRIRFWLEKYAPGMVVKGR